MNQVVFSGRLTKDADIRWTQTGKCLASFSLAVDRPFTYGDKKQTDFFNVVCWVGEKSKLADYLLKGTQVNVTGYLTNRSWEGKDGQKHFITELITNNGQVELMGGNKKREEKEEEKEQMNNMGTAVADDGKIPF